MTLELPARTMHRILDPIELPPRASFSHLKWTGWGLTVLWWSRDTQAAQNVRHIIVEALISDQPIDDPDRHTNHLAQVFLTADERLRIATFRSRRGAPWQDTQRMSDLDAALKAIVAAA